MTRRGLTLVELMMVVAVLAILAGVATPYLLGNLPTYRVNGATRQVVADLRLARTLAVERGAETYLVFDVPACSYILAVDSDASGSYAAGDEVVKTVALGANYAGVEMWGRDGDPVTFAGDVATLTPRGTATAGSVYLRPRGDAGVREDRERRVTVVGTTGRARAYRWDGAGWE